MCPILAVGKSAVSPVHHAETCAENGNDYDLFVDNGRFEGGQRSRDLDVLCPEVAECLVSHKHGEFAHDLAEFLGVCTHVAKMSDLVRDKRVSKKSYVFHVVFHSEISFFALLIYFTVSVIGFQGISAKY